MRHKQRAADARRPLARSPLTALLPSISGQQANQVGRMSRGRVALSSGVGSNGLDLNRRPLAREQMVKLVVSFSGQMPQILALSMCECQDLSSRFGGASGIRTPDPLPARDVAHLAPGASEAPSEMHSWVPLPYRHPHLAGRRQK